MPAICPLQDKRADPPRGTVELDSARHAATKRGAITSDRVVALARTPARRPRLPSDLDVFVAPRLRAFDAIASRMCTYHESFKDTTRILKGENLRSRAPVRPHYFDGKGSTVGRQVFVFISCLVGSV